MGVGVACQSPPEVIVFFLAMLQLLQEAALEEENKPDKDDDETHDAESNHLKVTCLVILVTVVRQKRGLKQTNCKQ